MKTYLLGLFIAFLLSGCFEDIDDSNSDSVVYTKSNISGHAIDGYIKDAIVFIDFNSNGIWDEDEPTTTTDENGYYTFKYIKKSKLSLKPSIVVYSGIDKTTGNPFEGELKAIVEEDKTNLEINITPITTLVDTLVDDNPTDEDINEAKEKIVLVFDLKKEDLNKDPIENFREIPQLYKKSITFMKIIEMLNHKTNQEQNMESFKEGMRALKDIVDLQTPFEEIEVISLSGVAVDMENELDIIDAKAQALEEIPNNGEGFQNELDNPEQILSLISKTDEEKVSEAKAIISSHAIRGNNISLNAVMFDLNLHINPYRTIIIWESSNQNIISNEGKVFQPEFGSSPQLVTLTAKISKGNIEDTKTFNVTVFSKLLPNKNRVERTKEALTFDMIKNLNSKPEQLTTPLSLVKENSFYGTTITWSSSEDVIDGNGIFTRPAYNTENKNVTLTATISKGSSNDTKSFELIILKSPMSDGKAVELASSSLSFSNILGANQDEDNIENNMNLPTQGLYDTSIVWQSSESSILSAQGELSRLSTQTSDEYVTLTATISKGEVTLTKEFPVIVLPLESNKVIEKDFVLLTFDTIRLKNLTQNNIVSNLNLEGNLPNGSTLSWHSSNVSFMNPFTGEVVRPDIANDETNQTVTLTASLTYDGEEKIKEFVLIVQAFDSRVVNAVQNDTNALTFETISGFNTNIKQITSNLELPTTGTNGSTITWESSFSNTLSTTGVIERPTFSDGLKEVTLTAKIQKDEVEKTKEFVLNILPFLEVDTSLAFEQKTYGLNGLSSNTLKTFRRNGVTYTLKSYSNLIVNDTYINSDTKSYQIQGTVNIMDIKPLKLSSDYKGQEIVLKLFRSDTTFDDTTFVEAKKITLNSSKIPFENFDLSEEESLRPPKVNIPDIESMPMPVGF
jgi:hypothetical protein